MAFRTELGVLLHHSQLAMSQSGGEKDPSLEVRGVFACSRVTKCTRVLTFVSVDVLRGVSVTCLGRHKFSKVIPLVHLLCQVNIRLAFENVCQVYRMH